MLSINYRDKLYRSTKRVLIFNEDAYMFDQPEDKRQLKEYELVIVELLLAGVGTADMVNTLGVNQKTVNHRVKTVLRYFGARDQTDFIVWMLGEGYAAVKKSRDDRRHPMALPTNRYSWGLKSGFFDPILTTDELKEHRRDYLFNEYKKYGTERPITIEGEFDPISRFKNAPSKPETIN